MITKAPVDSKNITLQAIVDLKMAFIQDDDLEDIKPDNVEDPILQVSKERVSVYELVVEPQRVLKGELAAIDFSGTDVVKFANSNGLLLVERRKRLFEGDKTLLQVARGNYISTYGLDEEALKISAEQQIMGIYIILVVYVLLLTLLAYFNRAQILDFFRGKFRFQQSDENEEDEDMDNLKEKPKSNRRRDRKNRDNLTTGGRENAYKRNR